MAHAISNAMRALSKDNDALMFAGFVGTQDSTTKAFTGADCDNGVICTMGKMAKFCGDSSMVKNGYARIFTKAAAATKAGLYIVDTAEVGYTIAMQNTVDPRNFYNEAGRAATVRKVKIGDEFQLSADAFTNTVGTNTYVEVDANGKLKFAAAATNAVAEVLGAEKMFVGKDFVDAYIIRFIAE